MVTNMLTPDLLHDYQQKGGQLPVHPYHNSMLWLDMGWGRPSSR
jgi:hypothetical protein